MTNILIHLEAIVDQLFLKYVLSDAWFISGEKAFFSPIFADTVMCADLNKNVIYGCSNLFDNETYRMHPSCFVANSKFFLLPDRGADIIVLDHEGKEKKKVVIDNPLKKRLGIRDYYIDGNVVWLVAKGLSSIIEFNTENEVILDVYTCYENRQSVIVGTCVYNNFIYFVNTRNEIYKFSISERLLVRICTVNFDDTFSALCFDGDFFWLSGKKNNLYRLSEDGKELKIISNVFENEDGLGANGEGAFSKAFFLNGKIWFMHHNGPYDIAIEKGSDRIFPIVLEKDVHSNCDIDHLPISYYLYIRNNRYIGKMFYPDADVYEIDSEEMEIRQLSLVIDRLQKKYLSSNIILKEIDSNSLEQFIDGI